MDSAEDADACAGSLDDAATLDSPELDVLLSEAEEHPVMAVPKRIAATITEAQRVDRRRGKEDMIDLLVMSERNGSALAPNLSSSTPEHFPWVRDGSAESGTAAMEW